jgi:transcriptional regulator with GAF, ATPase, and Fis domain
MELLGQSAGLASVRHAIRQVASTQATVLVLGETGTGKELVARSIHDQSPRRDKPFVAINGAALSSELMTSELFGHEAGAFTGAVKKRRGRFELAHGGTLFLDEVGDLPAALQVGLLRVLQERQFERVGGEEPITVDVRLIAATNKNLMQEIASGGFREDLFYRLNIFPITLPPLRDRPGDLKELVPHLVQHYAKLHGRTVRTISTHVMMALANYRWPGNVRELQNVIERAVILSEGNELAFDPSWLIGGSSANESTQTWAAQERERIFDALQAADGCIYGPGGAAHRLGLNPTTLYGKMRKHKIEPTAGSWSTS